MKFISSQLMYFVRQRGVKRNISYLMRFLLVLLAMIVIYSMAFHYIMAYEGKQYSWLTGVYWTLTVMTTLGFGDITFVSDLGRGFSIIVLISGVLFLLVMLPFTFIQYFYAPWLEAQKKERVPRSLPEDTCKHVIVVGISPIAINLAQDLERYGIHATLLSNDMPAILDLAEQGFSAVVGEHDDGETYKKLQVHKASLLIAMDTDVRNTNIVFSAREVDAKVPIATKVDSDDAIDILLLAGATYVFQFRRLLGEALARRVLSRRTRASIVGRYGDLVIAEAPVMRSFLVGKTVMECGLKNTTGVNIVAAWQRGKLILPTPTMVLTENTVIMVAGTMEEVQSFNALFHHEEEEKEGLVVILGGGRVGEAAATELLARGHDFRIVEKGRGNTNSMHADQTVHGDAADYDILVEAGIKEASAVIITTHDDDTNIYLTIYCRKLRPDIQVISRASFDRNVGILHAAGADLVLSLASLVSNSIINVLSPGKVMTLNEGIHVFRSAVGKRLIGHSLKESGIREHTNCNVVAIGHTQAEITVNPSPSHVFAEGERLYLIGDTEAEKAFAEFNAD